MEKLIASYVAFWVNAFNFNGRTRRRDYWYAYLGQFIISFVIGFIAGITGLKILSTIFALASFIPGIAICIRRLHDLGKSGLWYLLVFTGIGAIVLIVWFCMAGQSGSNQYGEDPKMMK